MVVVFLFSTAETVAMDNDDISDDDSFNVTQETGIGVIGSPTGRKKKVDARINVSCSNIYDTCSILMAQNRVHDTLIVLF